MTTTITFQAYCSDNRIHELPGIQPCHVYDEDEDRPATSAMTEDEAEDDYQHTIIFTNKRAFLRDFTAWTRKVAQDAWEVGGDDTYYDYYPGNFDAAHAIRDLYPETTEAVDFLENFAIAVKYGVDGQLDGLGLTYDEDEAISRFGKIMGQKLFYMAHLTANEMLTFGGFFISFHQKTARWKKIDHASTVNKTAFRRGLPKDLLPYNDKWLKYFKGK